MFTLQTKFSLAKAIITKNSPFYVQFYISKWCHLKCKMCNIVDTNSDIKPFDTEHINRIAENLVKIGTGVVLLTGGEPFLRSDIDEIVRIFKSKKLDVRLQTAGLYTSKKRIIRCVKNGARDINVSLDSLDEELSDFINGVKGSWRNAIKTISLISRVFPRRGSICALGCVLSKYNIDEVEAILDFATKIGWWVSLVPVHITTPDNPLNFRGYDENFMFSEEDYPKVRGLIENLKRKKKRGYLLFDSNDYLDSIYHFVTTGTPNWRHSGICDSPRVYFAILPDGRFAPCCDFEFDKDVYVYDERFPEIYKSQKFRRDVEKITRKCSGCNFGSFPEITLSVRSFAAIIERLILQFRASLVGIKPLSDSELFGIIDETKQKYDVYVKGRLLSNVK